jgi:hypothetical protein
VQPPLINHAVTGVGVPFIIPPFIIPPFIIPPFIIPPFIIPASYMHALGPIEPGQMHYSMFTNKMFLHTFAFKYTYFWVY